MKKMILMLALAGGASAFAGSAASMNAVYNPRTGMLEIWQGGKIVSTQPFNVAPTTGDPAADMARRNLLRRKGPSRNAAETAELAVLLKAYPVMEL